MGFWPLLDEMVFVNLCYKPAEAFKVMLISACGSAGQTREVIKFKYWLRSKT